MLVLEELKDIEEVLKDKYREKTCDIEVSSSVLFCYIIFHPPSPSPNWNLMRPCEAVQVLCLLAQYNLSAYTVKKPNS
jgi:hypothetical protein